MEDMEGSTRHGGGRGSIAVNRIVVISTLQLHYPYQDSLGKPSDGYVSTTNPLLNIMKERSEKSILLQKGLRVLPNQYGSYRPFHI